MISSAGIGITEHVVIIHEGRILHRTRLTNGNWSPWGSIHSPEGHGFVEVACCTVGSELRVIAKKVSGLFFHDIRFESGDWQGMAQLPDQPLLN